MIEIEDAVIRRGSFALAASLAVPAGRICAVIGPSGSGKSTLLEAVAGFLPLASGAIRVGGARIDARPPADRPVTLLFQDDNLFPHLTVEANTGLGLKPSLSLTAAEKRKVAGVLAEVGLGDLGRRRPADLSGGQRQRAALARALLRDRPALLLDEPLAALGPALRAQMLELIERSVLPRGIAVLMITHAPEDVRGIAHLTAFCDDGRIEGAHPTGAMMDAPGAALAAYLGEERGEDQYGSPT